MSSFKPKIFQDIKAEHDSVFTAASPLVNLRGQKVVRVPLMTICKTLVIIAAGIYFFFGLALAPVDTQAQTADDQRTALEAQLQVLETQINQYQTQIATVQKQGTSLKGEISELNAKVASLNLEIKAINITLQQVAQNIGQTQQQITTTQSNISSSQAALANLVLTLYQNDQTSLMEIFLAHPQLSDFFDDVNDVEVLQGSVQLQIAQVRNYQQQLVEHQQELSLAKTDAESMQQYQLAEAQQVQQTQEQKTTLLAQTQGEESKYQQLLTQTQLSAAQIRDRIFQLLGGGQLTFEQAYQYAKAAGDATGVDPAFILAILDRESALGANVGKCTYTQSMSPTQQPVFLQLVASLHLDPNSVSVSCAIPSDGTYGGAMGPAQFLPTTWMTYSSAISAITNDTPASPWNNLDAFTATALYMKDLGAVNASIDQERIAAAKYYAGSNYSRFLWTYGEAVVERTQEFQQDIQTITQSGSSSS